MKKLTKKQINYLLKTPLPDFKFDYSGDDYALAYEDRDFRDAVTNYNYVLPALKYHMKSGSLSTWNEFNISIKDVLQVKRHLHKIKKVL